MTQPTNPTKQYIALVGEERIALPEGITTAADAKSVLLKSGYPEVKNAKITSKQTDDAIIYQFAPKPGRKG